ncbi:DUF308 domain-containing protein [Corticibacterium sp. UT-5YL-CI-8]|nr:DUF308 domain-containing protein [Tianweitania sp. UT-5YL-CI-8]
MSVASEGYKKARMGAIVAVLILIAGLFAMFSPAEALRFLVIAGGGLLVIDGIMGLTTQRLSGPMDGKVIVGLVRNGLSVLAGLLILAGVFWNLFESSFLGRFIGVLLVLIGFAELISGIVGRGSKPIGFFALLLSAAAYLVAGFALIFVQISSAVFLVKLLAAAAIVYAAAHLYRSWRAYGAYSPQ